MTEDRLQRLLELAPMDRRALLRRLLIGGAVIYAPPAIVTFSVVSDRADAGAPLASNQELGDPGGMFPPEID